MGKRHAKKYHSSETEDQEIALIKKEDCKYTRRQRCIRKKGANKLNLLLDGAQRGVMGTLAGLACESGSRRTPRQGETGSPLTEAAGTTAPKQEPQAGSRGRSSWLDSSGRWRRKLSVSVKSDAWAPNIKPGHVDVYVWKKWKEMLKYVWTHEVDALITDSLNIHRGSGSSVGDQKGKSYLMKRA